MRDVHTGETLMAPEHDRGGSGCEKEQMVFRANRNALRQWLLDVGEEEIDVRYEHRLKSFKGEMGNVRAEFENGAVFRGEWSSRQTDCIRPPEVLPAVVFHGDLELPIPTFHSLLAPYMGKSNILAGVGDSFNTPITIADVTPSAVHLDWSYSRPAFRKESPSSNKEIPDPLFNPTRTLEQARQIPEQLLTDLATAGLAAPFRDILNPAQIRKNGCYNWLSQSVFIPRAGGLDQGIERGVVFVGDAAHAMPIFGGEGGNHALLDAVELVRSLTEGENGNENGVELRRRVNAYYDGAYRRCQGAVRRCRQRFLLLHRPVAEWRALAVKRG
ncbi:MAG: hypothetical protein Q9214_007745 [Letrouitia sp. 1 TL-2023]